MPLLGLQTLTLLTLPGAGKLGCLWPTQMARPGCPWPAWRGGNSNFLGSHGADARDFPKVLALVATGAWGAVEAAFVGPALQPQRGR